MTTILTDEVLEQLTADIDEKPEIDLTEWAEDIARAVLNLRWGVKNNIISLLDSGDVDPLDILVAAPSLEAQISSRPQMIPEDEYQRRRREFLEDYKIDWEKLQEREPRQVKTQEIVHA